MSMTIGKFLITSLALITGCAFASTEALAQSTPIPNAGSHEGNDHSEAPATEILEGHLPSSKAITSLGLQKQARQ